jgi:hypothetical protein
MAREIRVRARSLGLAALGGLVGAATVASVAAGGPGLKPFGVLHLDGRGKVPQAALPKVRKAKNADRLSGRRGRRYLDSCPEVTVKIGTTCMMANPYPLTNTELGRSDYFFATRTCAAIGGYLPTAAELIGAAPYVKLASRVDDNEVTASTDFDPTDGLKDRREMSADLTTTASGGRAAGSIGVSDNATGDPKTGEPDPTPLPANPSPETLAYIMVWDNGDLGGFGGAEPVGSANLFRCAFNLAQRRAGGIG